jgi:archaellum component FlaC
MSDTPRTDAACNIYDLQIVAEDIERELNTANSEIERLTNKVAQLYEGAEEQKQRIKRLEEAGDALANNHNPFTFIDWNKAKEAKP